MGFAALFPSSIQSNFDTSDRSDLGWAFALLFPSSTEEISTHRIDRISDGLYSVDSVFNSKKLPHIGQIGSRMGFCGVISVFNRIFQHTGQIGSPFSTSIYADLSGHMYVLRSTYIPSLCFLQGLLIV